MRQYYASDKKKREDAKKKQKEEKRVKKLNKASKNSDQTATEPASNAVGTEADVPTQTSKS